MAVAGLHPLPDESRPPRRVDLARLAAFDRLMAKDGINAVIACLAEMRPQAQKEDDLCERT
jgi:hypothetical protein